MDHIYAAHLSPSSSPTQGSWNSVFSSSYIHASPIQGSMEVHPQSSTSFGILRSGLEEQVHPSTVLNTMIKLPNGSKVGLHGSQHSMTSVQSFPRYLQSPPDNIELYHFTVFALEHAKRPVTSKPIHKTFLFGFNDTDSFANQNTSLPDKQRRLDFARIWVSNIRSVLAGEKIGGMQLSIKYIKTYILFDD
jgi:hypothetical protein